MFRMNKTGIIKKLQTAINMKGHRLLYCTSEFYSVNYGRPIIMYIVKHADIMADGHTDNRLLFKSASQLRVVFFMRDLWDDIQNGVEIDTATENALKKQKNYATKHDILEGRAPDGD